MHDRQFDLVVVANRLPVDFHRDESGELSWKRSPGGLVTALEPVLRENSGAWVGWGGIADLAAPPFEADGIFHVPIELAESEIEDFYEGFSNATIWPLYHDVITPPEYHRAWWDTYRKVNRRFARLAADYAAPGATVWVHDYQLQLVPQLVRQLRPDVRIGFFNHIPFPPWELFAQLPWRRQILAGLLGADMIGFQRSGDAGNFLRAVRRLTNSATRGSQISIGESRNSVVRHAYARAFPISIDTGQVEQLAASPEVQARARQIREELGNPQTVMLGVDRLDYTKGIRHRLKAYGELLEEGRVDIPGTVLVQVASPSRENVGAYQLLRAEVEVTVARINGDYGGLGQVPVSYLHQSFPYPEMIALYQAADVMLVTSLRDGMNLVAKEYVASRCDERGALVLSEFTGAADQLTGALMVNPHDIEALKDTMVRAAAMDTREQRRRMRSLRRKVEVDDVSRWAAQFLTALRAAHPDPVRDEDELAAVVREASNPPVALAMTGGEDLNPADVYLGEHRVPGTPQEGFPAPEPAPAVAPS